MLGAKKKDGSMERFLAERKVEIELELLQIEADVWADVVAEQQTLVDAENEILDQLYEDVFKARRVHNDILRKMTSGAEAEPTRSSKGNDTVSQSQQTDPQRAPTSVEIRRDELRLLMEEVGALELVAGLLEEQKRLAEEPTKGKAFIELREACRLEKDRVSSLDSQLVELQKASNAVRAGQRVAVVSGASEAVAVSEDFSWAEAPWDLDSAEDSASGTSQQGHQGHQGSQVRSTESYPSLRVSTASKPVVYAPQCTTSVNPPRPPVPTPLHPSRPPVSTPRFAVPSAVVVDRDEWDADFPQPPAAAAGPKRFVPKKAVLSKRR